MAGSVTQQALSWSLEQSAPKSLYLHATPQLLHNFSLLFNMRKEKQSMLVQKRPDCGGSPETEKNPKDCAQSCFAANERAPTCGTTILDSHTACLCRDASCQSAPQNMQNKLATDEPGAT